MSDCICHISVNTISRSAGRSATASVAYRNGDKIRDERTGETFDYSHKTGVEYVQNILPEGIAGEYSNSELWNAAEQAEKRINSTVAREYIIALPHELTPDGRRELAVQFAAHIVGTYGVAANVAIHQPGKHGDGRNHHAHIMTSTRTLTPQGFGEKTRILDDRKTGPEEVKKIRETWAAMSNACLERGGSGRRMDARSFAERGLERVPEVHLGPAAAAMERRHARWEEAGAKGAEPPTSERGDRNRGIRELNALIAKRDALKARLEAEPETMEEARQRLIIKLSEDLKARGIPQSFWNGFMRNEVFDLEEEWYGKEQGAEPQVPKAPVIQPDADALERLRSAEEARRVAAMAAEREERKEKAAKREPERREAERREAGAKEGATAAAPMGGPAANDRAASPKRKLAELQGMKARLDDALAADGERLAVSGIRELERLAGIDLRLLGEEKSYVERLVGKLDEEGQNLKNPDILDRWKVTGGMLRVFGWNNIDINADWERRRGVGTSRVKAIEEDIDKREAKLKADIEGERAKSGEEARRRYPDAVRKLGELAAEISAIERVIRLDGRIQELDRSLEKCAYSPGSAGFRMLADHAAEVIRLERERSGAGEAKAMEMHPAAVKILRAHEAHQRERGRGGMSR